MARITQRDLENAIINLNHNSDNQLKAVQNILDIINKGFARNDEQHQRILEEMNDQKREMILLRKETNKIILYAFMILGGIIGLTKFIK